MHPYTVPAPQAPTLLLLIALPPHCVAALRATWRLVTPAGDAARADRDTGHTEDVEVVITNGSTGLAAAQMQALPRLRLICCHGAGYENVDLHAAWERGIAVTHAPGINHATVADHAMALLLAAARAVPLLDRAVRNGGWLDHRAARPALHGKRLGVVGMGNIGMLVARRAAAFDMHIAYHARHCLPALSYRYIASVLALARESDYLLLACPGGAATHHLVDAPVLQALGPQGFLVNVARGSVVDTAALLQALRDGVIAGAALDVIEGEPGLPGGAAQLDTLIVTPHVAGRSPEAQQAQQAALLDKLQAYIERRPLSNELTPHGQGHTA